MSTLTLVLVGQSCFAKQECFHCHRLMRKQWKYLGQVKAVQIKIFSDSNTEKWQDH